MHIEKEIQGTTTQYIMLIEQRTKSNPEVNNI